MLVAAARISTAAAAVALAAKVAEERISVDIKNEKDDHGEYA